MASDAAVAMKSRFDPLGLLNPGQAALAGLSRGSDQASV
jgi:hypothetical protein